jgi:hypothetical protein
MNESEFEESLRALRPVAPSPALEERIAGELSASHAIKTIEAHAAVLRSPAPLSTAGSPSLLARIFPGFAWACAGAAAAVAVLAALGVLGRPAAAGTAPVASAGEADFESRGVFREVVSAEDGGVVYEDELPARLVRYTTLERRIWTHPVTGAWLEVETPRDDVVLMPVAMQ